MTETSTDVVRAELCILALRETLENMESNERMIVFDFFSKIIGGAYCLDCGFEHPPSRICQCENDE